MDEGSGRRCCEGTAGRRRYVQRFDASVVLACGNIHVSIRIHLAAQHCFRHIVRQGHCHAYGKSCRTGAHRSADNPQAVAGGIHRVRQLLNGFVPGSCFLGGLSGSGICRNRYATAADFFQFTKAGSGNMAAELRCRQADSRAYGSGPDGNTHQVRRNLLVCCHVHAGGFPDHCLLGNPRNHRVGGIFPFIGVGVDLSGILHVRGISRFLIIFSVFKILAHIAGRNINAAG